MSQPKPHLQVPIVENHEPLVPIPTDVFARVSPHPYQKLGAPYGARSPFFLRAPVLARLGQAQTRLQEQQPGWRLQIFDAYRPIPVQGFMVNYAFQELVQDQGLDAQNLSPEQEQRLWDQVGQFWAEPSPDPTMPPPHSTGAAVDVTLVDGEDTPVDMGSPIDELSPRSYPDHFAQDPSPEAQQYHGARLLLRQVMVGAGFCNHPQEWWHFSYGDQRWAWLLDQVKPLEQPRVACYGTVT